MFGFEGSTVRSSPASTFTQKNKNIWSKQKKTEIFNTGQRLKIKWKTKYSTEGKDIRRIRMLKTLECDEKYIKQNKEIKWKY